jgi:hypothetical protein
MRKDTCQRRMIPFACGGASWFVKLHRPPIEQAPHHFIPHLILPWSTSGHSSLSLSHTHIHTHTQTTIKSSCAGSLKERRAGEALEEVATAASEEATTIPHASEEDASAEHARRNRSWLARGRRRGRARGGTAATDERASGRSIPPSTRGLGTRLQRGDANDVEHASGSRSHEWASGETAAHQFLARVRRHHAARVGEVFSGLCREVAADYCDGHRRALSGHWQARGAEEDVVVHQQTVACMPSSGTCLCMSFSSHLNLCWISYFLILVKILTEFFACELFFWVTR